MAAPPPPPAPRAPKQGAVSGATLTTETAESPSFGYFLTFDIVEGQFATVEDVLKVLSSAVVQPSRPRSGCVTYAFSAR